ncbi:MAG: hypothetical protein SFV51_18225 [Bryobacteraceae bacterium]|nr:hypothetical protein [Bryobacteraceae bacterium]
MGGVGLTGYLLSLPERLIRSASALAGGLVREVGDVAVPSYLRRTRLYRSLVDTTLRFLIEQVGEVEGTYPGEAALAENFLTRRAAGNGIELVGILAFRASPVWVMAALADVSGAGKTLVRRIAQSLQEQGLLNPETKFDTVDQILDGLEQTAGQVAEAINTPPLDVTALREELATIRRHAASIPPRNLPDLADLESGWRRLEAAARREQRPVFEMSAVLALAAVRELPENVRWLSRCAQSAALTTSQVLASSLLGHYTRSLDEIRQEGFLAYWQREFRPYLIAAARHFSPGRKSLTQRLLGR